MKKLYVFAMLLVVAAMALSAWSPGQMSTLTLKNKVVNEVINVKLNGVKWNGINSDYPPVSYYLTAIAPKHVGWSYTSGFDIHKDIYDVTIYMCGAERSEYINLVHSVRLVFSTCYTTVNSGEPGNEKVDLVNSKPGTFNTEEDSYAGDGIDNRSAIHTYHYSANGSQIWWRLDWANWWNGSSDILEPFAP